VRIGLLFDRNTSSKSSFSKWRMAHFGQNRPIELSCRNTSIYQKKIICVRSRSIMHIVSLWEWGFCQIYTSYNLYVSRWRYAQFVPNLPIQLSWRNTCVSPKKTTLLEAGTSSTLFPCDIELIFEGILPANHIFQCGQRLFLFQIGLFS
jgi:hypothetical protein